MNKHKETLEETNDNIKADKSSIMALEFAIRKLTKEISRREASNARALEKRQEDQQDYEDTIKAFDTAIKAMELTQAQDFLQTSKPAQAQKVLVAKRAVKKAMVLAESRATEEQLKVFKSFIQTGAAPHSQGVDKHGSVVIDLLKSLKADFEKQKVESTKEETEDKNQYNLAKQAQDYAIKEANSNKDTKSTDLSDNEATRDDEEGALASDTAQLNSVKADCTTKANEWDVRSKTRMGEIEAMSMAVKILEKVTNVRNPDTHEQPAKVYLQEKVSLLQISDPKAKAMNLLKEVAVKTHSKALQKLATEIGAFAGPFDKIKAMIQKMVFRLMADQKDEDDHKNWCDMELEKSNESKDDKDNRMELLDAKIATANADVAKLTKEIADDDQSASDITKYMEEEKELRKENKDENVATIKDAQDAQQAVADATAVLKNFYKESRMIAKEPYEFVQTKKDVDLPENPATWDSSYTGVADPEAEGTGVLSILGECGKNFASMEADAASQEETDEKAFQDDMTAQSMDKAEKEKSAEMKGSRKTALMQKLEGMNENKAHLTKELEAVNTYLKDLEPACVSGDSSYAERKAARSDEITALRKAQNILQDAFNPGFLQKK